MPYSSSLHLKPRSIVAAYFTCSNEIYENIITKYDKFIIKKIGKTSISLKSFDINDKRDITTKYSSYSANKNDYIGVA